VTSRRTDEPRPEAPADPAEYEERPDDLIALGPEGPRTKLVRGTVEWVAIVAIALLAAFLIKQFLVQAFYIPSASMEHTLEISDRVLVNKLSYRLHDVNRGDLVVFKRPPAGSEGSTRDLIKRVIALPGETVEGRDGAIHVNGKPLSEPYVAPGSRSGDFPAQRVPPEHVWVMGDNRLNSRDSRVFGSVRQSLIVGRAFIRIWPIGSIKLL
jgi:signal peptidase I